MYADKDLKVIPDNKGFVSSDGTQYPWSYPKNEIPELTLVSETPRPDDPLLNVTGFVIDEEYNQVWQTEEKPADQKAEEAMRDWTSRMASADDDMPDYMEDLIDTLEGLVPVMDNIPSRLLDAYNKKKSIRAEKPQG